MVMVRFIEKHKPHTPKAAIVFPQKKKAAIVLIGTQLD
jgi:hypothetical protein